ncbi:uncharacterized protein TNIN_397412 [Trichonephila inaurata madagascariensis]|uniref:Claspin n=1 Tax=Trichonephila inaurata madagascariensis TaxID=2747483 RepID=A0A8X6WR44_9ARAC|nr:uncharacterized protein TNIN_397412 [Trichonephila inaurata madagascariensis]
MSSVEFCNMLGSLKTDCSFVSEDAKVNDSEKYDISMNQSNFQEDEIIVNCTADEITGQGTHAKVSKSVNDDDNFSAVNGINTDSEEIIKTSGIVTPYNDKDNLTVDVSVNDTTANSEAKTKTREFVGFDNGENNCSVMNTSIDAIVTDSEDKGETYQSTELFNNEDDIIANASVDETSSNFEEMAKMSKPASLDNNKDFSTTDPPFEGIASDSEAASKDNDGNILVKDVSQNGIGASSDEVPNTFDSLEPNASDEPSEINEKETKSKADKSSKYPLHRRRDTTETPLPYYRQPKPDFFEYTKRLSEKLNPNSPALSHSRIGSQSTPNSSSNIELEEFHEPSNQESPQLQVPQSNLVSKRIIFSPRKKSFGSNNLSAYEKTTPDLIILDDYEPSSHTEKSYPSIGSRPKGLKIPSVLHTTKQKSEPSPGAKYLALKEQLMEKIMLKKEASLSRRKEQEELDEENFDPEENFLENEAVESDAGSSDDDSEDEVPENTVDFSEHQDLINISDQRSKDNKADEISEVSERQFNAGGTISRDSQESIRCFSLPSFQPGGGFSNSFNRGGTSASIFNDTTDDSNDMLPDLNGLFQQENVSDSDHKSNKVELLASQGGDDKEVIPLWESLPIAEKQGSQLFDDDISAICSGKFTSANDEIPWTPSSTNEKDQPSNDDITPLFPFNSSSKHGLDQADDSSDEELVRPSKKIRLSKHEKLWDSDDENEDDAAIEEDMELDGDVEDKNKDNVNADEHEELDVDFDEENQSNVDSAEENESDEDVSESLIRKNTSLKTPDLDDEGVDELVQEPSKQLEIKNFFENEAELSGEEGSSDENEDDLDEYVADDLITNEVLTNEEKLRKEIGAIHFKRQQDEDDQVIRQLKNDFLPEGELYSENGSRKRKYVWNNMVADDEYTETKSDSEEEEVENIQPDYLKWQQEKNKADLPEIDNEKIEISKSIGLKVDILGKVSVTRCNTITSTKISLSPMQRRGSFLNSSIGMNSKFIKEFSDSPGAVTRKNFVFSALKQDNTKALPSSPVTEVKNTKPTINNSIFNKI